MLHLIESYFCIHKATLCNENFIILELPFKIMTSLEFFKLMQKKNVFFYRQTKQYIKRRKPKRAPPKRVHKKYTKGAETSIKRGLRQKPTSPPHKLQRTQQASYKRKVHIRNAKKNVNQD